MACHEVAALRLCLHTLLGDRPQHERDHENAELESVLGKAGPLDALAEARSLADAREALRACGLDLEQRVAALDPATPDLGYQRALVVQVRNALRSVERASEDLARFYQDLDEAHDLLHEVFPESD